MARVQPLVCRDMYGTQRGDADHRMCTRTLAPHCTGRSLCSVLCGGQCSLSSFVMVLFFAVYRNSYAASVGVWRALLRVYFWGAPAADTRSFLR